MTRDTSVIGDKKILAIVPARGGSKGIPLKNLKQVGGRSLVAWAGLCVSKVPQIDRSIISTDHKLIAKEGEDFGLSAPFLRPDKLAGDRIGDFEVLEHALKTCEKLDNTTYDIILMLQPTSPLRKPSHIQKALLMLVEQNLDAVWSVSPTDLKYHPLKQLKAEGGKLEFFHAEGANIIARQQLSPVYHRNGVVYAFTRECLLDQQSIMGNNSGALIVDEPNISIDTLQDIEAVEQFMQQNDD